MTPAGHELTFCGQGMTGNLAFAIAASAVGAAFQHGYSTGVTNAPQPLIERFIGHVIATRDGSSPEKGRVNYLFSIIVAVFCVGGMFGALSTAFVANKIGRKGGLLYNNVLVLAAALCFGLCKTAKSFEVLIVGRFIIGFNSGLSRLSSKRSTSPLLQD